MSDRKVKKKPKKRSKKPRNKCRMQKKESKMLTGEKLRLKRKDWLRKLRGEQSWLINRCLVPNPRITLGKMEILYINYFKKLLYDFK